MLAACTLLKVCQTTNPLCGGLSHFCMLVSGEQPGAPEQAQRLIREAAALLGTRGAAVLQKYRSAAHAPPGLTRFDFPPSCSDVGTLPGIHGRLFWPVKRSLVLAHASVNTFLQMAGYTGDNCSVHGYATVITADFKQPSCLWCLQELLC